MSPKADLLLPVSGRDHIQGEASSPVTLLEYGDYECPYCGSAYILIKGIQKQFDADLRFVFRNFPLTQLHPNAKLAAEAAEAAAGQGKFWEMHDALYESQALLGPDHVISLASNLGLDLARFSENLAHHQYWPRVREDFMSGVKSGVAGTPGFFINGVRFDGNWSGRGLVDALVEARASLVA